MEPRRSVSASTLAVCMAGLVAMSGRNALLGANQPASALVAACYLCVVLTWRLHFVAVGSLAYTALLMSQLPHDSLGHGRVGFPFSCAWQGVCLGSFADQIQFQPLVDASGSIAVTANALCMVLGVWLAWRMLARLLRRTAPLDMAWGVSLCQPILFFVVVMDTLLLSEICRRSVVA